MVLGGKNMTKTWKTRWCVAQFYTLYFFKDEKSTAKPSLVIDLSHYTEATVVETARSGKSPLIHFSVSFNVA